MPEINPATGCYCTFAQHMLGDGCSICNPRYVDDLPEEAEEAGIAELNATASDAGETGKEEGE